MISNVVVTPFDRIKIGMPVKVFFEPAGEDISLPKFRVAGEAEQAQTGAISTQEKVRVPFPLLIAR